MIRGQLILKIIYIIQHKIYLKTTVIPIKNKGYKTLEYQKLILASLWQPYDVIGFITSQWICVKIRILKLVYKIVIKTR